MPPIVLKIVAILGLIEADMPAAQKIYAEARELFDMLFKGGLITVEQQYALKTWADAHEAATLAGEVPPALQVEPDPV